MTDQIEISNGQSIRILGIGESIFVRLIDGVLYLAQEVEGKVTKDVQSSDLFNFIDWDIPAQSLDDTHPRYADWQYEVANGDTRLGFAEWLEHNPED